MGLAWGLHMRNVIVLACILLSGCAAAPVVHTPVIVTKYVYVRVDPALTRTKPIPEPRNRKVREALRVARERKADLEVCYADKRAISQIEGTPVP